MTTETHLAPLAVYDARTPSWTDLTDERRAELRDWVQGLGVEVSETYRVEIYLLDCLFARIHQDDRDEDGNRYCPHDHAHDRLNCKPARRAPFESSRAT